MDFIHWGGTKLSGQLHSKRFIDTKRERLQPGAEGTAGFTSVSLSPTANPVWEGQGGIKPPLAERQLRAARSAYACPEGRLVGTRPLR